MSPRIFAAHHAGLSTHMKSQLQANRSEFKYLVTPEQAIEIRQYLQQHMVPDSNSPIESVPPGQVESQSAGYPVCSVYLDSPDAKLFGQTVQGQRNRFKLRVRVYDDDPRQPAFAEIKRRVGQTIIKKRVAVERGTAQRMLSGQAVSPSDLKLFQSSDGTAISIRDLDALNEFCSLRDSIAAVGTTYVHYLREAWVSPIGNSWRATFDRQLKSHLYRAGDELTIPADLIPTPEHDLIVFELKFTSRFPHWMQQLTHQFSLRAESFPKYVRCYCSLTAPPACVWDATSSVSFSSDRS